MNWAGKDKIKKLALDIDHNVAFGGKSRGNKHLLRVVKVARFLAQKTGADPDIVVAGAFLHDTALPSGNDYEYGRNKKIVRQLIKPFNLSQEEKDAISECVASHEGIVKPKTLEAKVVHDADVLEKVGLLGIIRHTSKTTNQNKLDPFAISETDTRKILDHIAWRRKRLQTPLARKIANYLTVYISKQQVETLIGIAANLAAQSVITEKIAVSFRPHLTKSQNEKLREQLRVTYLRKF